MQVVISPSDGEALVGNAFAQERLGGSQFSHNLTDVGSNRAVKVLIRADLGVLRRQPRSYDISQFRHMSGQVFRAQSRVDRAATFMTEYQDKFAPQMLNSIFHTSKNHVVHHMSRNPDHEEIAQTLVRNNLDGFPGIGTCQHDGKGMLSLRYLQATRYILVRMTGAPLRKPTIPLQQARDAFLCTYAFYSLNGMGVLRWGDATASKQGYDQSGRKFQVGHITPVPVRRHESRHP
jgi:hypothetical protein